MNIFTETPPIRQWGVFWSAEDTETRKAIRRNFVIRRDRFLKVYPFIVGKQKKIAFAQGVAHPPLVV